MSEQQTKKKPPKSNVNKFMSQPGEIQIVDIEPETEKRKDEEVKQK